MKPILDIIQIALNYPLGAVLVALAAFIALRGVSLSIRYTKAATVAFWRFVKSRWIRLAVMSVILYSFRVQVSDRLQYWEQQINPVYVFAFDTAQVLRAYQTQLAKNTTPGEYKVISDSIKQWQIEFGMSSTAFYECAYPECDLNPFVIRRDGVAAGLIQFTNAGCVGIGYDLNRIKEACRNRDAVTICTATGRYLRTRAKNRRLSTGKDVYLCVFAPGFIGAEDEKVLYQAPTQAYKMNRGLDGWVMNGSKITRNPGSIDGRITAGELGLWLEFKKMSLIKT